MKRASPVELRAALEAATTMARAGILFVPMPALDQADHDALANQMHDRLEKLEQEASAQDAGHE
ncbi:Protein of unknown function [Geopseudomonas sagittaria]|uniref:DUF1382 family protein n=1 Tax=Geopseudomonas sagittaria TaxID=1135990 RepID=A0A1I5YRT8_9GAMM|nr:DUF1382 family protein [Pseudomonas sagittaria]SFQ46810.1 Protein of unknown function [Pseudomonas sagittaria]